MEEICADMNLLKVRKMDLSIGLTKNEDVFIEGLSVTTMFGVKTFTETFLLIKDNKILSGRHLCTITKKNCSESKLTYDSIKKQFIPDNEILVVANPRKKEELMNFLNDII